MTSEYLRLQSLLRDAGLPLEEGGISQAEIYAYSEGLALFAQRLDSIKDCLFLTISDAPDTEKYVSLLQLNTSLLRQEDLLPAIVQRLSQNYAATTVSSQRAHYRLFSLGNYAAQNSRVLFFPDPAYTFEELQEFGRFLLAYLPAGMTARCSSDGMTFDAWDALDKCFYELDSLQIPFSITDTLRNHTP